MLSPMTTSVRLCLPAEQVLQSCCHQAEANGESSMLSIHQHILVCVCASAMVSSLVSLVLNETFIEGHKQKDGSQDGAA